MALTDYTTIGDAAYLIDRNSPDEKHQVITRSIKSWTWAYTELGVNPTGQNTFYLTDEQLSMFILKFS